MIIIITLIAILVGSLVWARCKKGYLEIPLSIAFGSACLLVMISITIPVIHLATNEEVARFRAVRATVHAARLDGIPLESAAIQIKVTEANQWLAGAQYYRGTLFRCWVPATVDTLELLR